MVGIYETGETFEEGGALLRFDDAQALLGRPNQVSLIYIRLKDPSLADKNSSQRVERLYPQLSLTTGQALANQNLMSGTLEATVWGVAALAIIIGGVSMMNAQLMAVLERTREIGVLRAVGWKSWRVLLMILGESVLVGLLGGVIGTVLAWLVLRASVDQLSAYGATSTLQPDLLLRAFVVVFVLGLVGGLYPAIRAARLQPIEALRYEGGTLGRHAARLPLAGLALQNLWQRKGRTGLTLAVIAITIGAIMVLNSIMTGFTAEMGQMFGGAQIVVRQAEAADLSVAFIDQRVGQRIAALPGVQQVSGTLLTALMNEQVGIFMLLGDEPRSVPMQSFNIVDGQAVTGSGQIMIGQQYAEANHIRIGDIITLGDVRFRVVGIYTHPVSFYELGGVATLRDVQSFMGKPRKVTFFSVVVSDPSQAQAMADKINAEFPEVHASLSGEFASQLPDMQNANAMVGAVALIAILVGGVGVMNTMLMAVLERTREIGVLRALGWRRRAILGLILRESLALGVIGAALAVVVAFGFAALLNAIPDYGAVMDYSWSVDVFAQALGAAVGLGVVGGLYPAFRATRLQPVEALRYE